MPVQQGDGGGEQTGAEIVEVQGGAVGAQIGELALDPVVAHRPQVGAALHAQEHRFGRGIGGEGDGRFQHHGPALDANLAAPVHS